MKSKVRSILFAISLSCPLITILPEVYAQGGVPLWTNRYGAETDFGLLGLAMDSSGNVFVAATSSQLGTGVIVKYSNSGVPLWTNLYQGTGVAYRALATDSSGNVVVTGSSTIKYSNSGVPLWTNSGGFAIAIDSSGNVFVTGSGHTEAFSSSGDPLWAAQNDISVLQTAIALDGTGNVFVTGGSTHGGTQDYETIKYSNLGAPLCTNWYNGPANGDDSPYALAVDDSGNVLVTGVSVVSANNSDYATIKYSNSGVPLWTNRYNGPGNSYDSGNAVAVDRAGNVFVTGPANGQNYYATISYSNGGAPLWTNLYPAGQGGTAYAIALDNGGNVFVTGESGDGHGYTDYATVAYSNGGAPLWTRRYNGLGNLFDTAKAIAVDKSGNVFVSGSSRNENTYSDLVTIKYSSSLALPRLDFQKLNNQLVLRWTNVGFNLQSAPFASGTFTNIPGATSPYTNSFTAPRQFFRLAQ